MVKELYQQIYLDKNNFQASVPKGLYEEIKIEVLHTN